MDNEIESVEESADIAFFDKSPVVSTAPQELISSDSTLKEIIQEDLEHMNNIIRGLYHGWSRANSVSKICKLATTQAEILIQRRKLLLKPSSFREHKEFSSPKKKTFEFETL